jgi:hypothetical protein
MNQKIKILLAFGIPALLVGGYWFGFRNRKPKLSIESVDWIAKKGIVKFGNVKNEFSLNKGGSMKAGETYSDLYTLTYAPSDVKGLEMVTMTLFKNGIKIQEKIIDFKAKSMSNLM